MIKYYLAKIRKKLRFSAIKNSHIDKYAHISAGNTILMSEIGKYSYTGYDTSILYASIGAYCSISSNVQIGGGEHLLDGVSTSPLFLEGDNIFHRNLSNKKYEPYKRIEIGNDVWIGQNVMIKGGVSIGNGAVIGMGAVVTKDIGSYEIWAGNPARFIRKRFDDDTIRQLENLEWWLWDEDKVKRYSEYFASAQELCTVVRENEK